MLGVLKEASRTLLDCCIQSVMLLRSPSYRSEVVGVNDRRARLERRPAARWCRGCSEGAAAAAVALEPSRSYSRRHCSRVDSRGG